MRVLRRIVLRTTALGHDRRRRASRRDRGPRAAAILRADRPEGPQRRPRRAGVRGIAREGDLRSRRLRRHGRGADGALRHRALPLPRRGPRGRRRAPRGQPADALDHPRHAARLGRDRDRPHRARAHGVPRRAAAHPAGRAAPALAARLVLSHHRRRARPRRDPPDHRGTPRRSTPGRLRSKELEGGRAATEIAPGEVLLVVETPLVPPDDAAADGLAVAPPPTPAALLLAERAIAGRATVLVVGAGFADMLPPPAPPTEGPRAPR